MANINTDRLQLRRGFGWKRIVNSGTASNEEYQVLKGIIHDYPDLKDYCRFFENKRRSIIAMARLEETDATFLNGEKLRGLLLLPLDDGDKKMLFAYFDARTKVMALEIGMEGLPEGMYREIAYDRYFGRLSYKDIMKKYEVNHKTVQRALKRASDYLVTYAKWYLDLSFDVKDCLERKKCPF